MNAIKTNFGEAGEKAAEYGAATFWRMLEVLAERTEEAIQLDVSGKIGASTDAGTTTVFGKLNGVGEVFAQEITPIIAPISEGIMIPKFTKAIIASGSFTIPKDGTYKIIACGAGGTFGVGGGGCAIDQRDYVEGDVLTLTASGAASGICTVRSLSMTANGTATGTGGTASGGNIANYTGGATGVSSNGCGGGAASSTVRNGADGGIIGGDGSSGYGGNGGNGGYIGGDGGYTTSSSYYAGNGGSGGYFGGKGGDSGYADANRPGGIGGSGIVGGNGGSHVSVVTTSTPKTYGGNGGYGELIGGNGGNSAHTLLGYGFGGIGGSGGGVRGGTPVYSGGGAGGNMGMGWAIPFKEVLSWTKGNAIIFIEEV